MELKSKKELGLKGMGKVLVVKPECEGGSMDEVMPIGHSKKSHTFVPQIETVGQDTVLDSPGFADNRGAEINIANTVNIRESVSRTKTVRVVVLINYFSLRADRARGLMELLEICSKLFGTDEEVEAHKESLLVGISQLDPAKHSLEDLKEEIVEDMPELMQILVDRIFIFDPLDRGAADRGFLSREQCLQKIRALPPIVDPAKIFQTVLTDNDEVALLTITSKMSEDMVASLKEKKYTEAATCLLSIQQLSVIEHISVERYLHQSQERVQRHFQHLSTACQDHCSFERFKEAEAAIREVRAAVADFDQVTREVKLLEIEGVDVEELDRQYKNAKQVAEERKERELRQQKELEAAHNQVGELRKLLSEQKQELEKERVERQKQHEEERKRNADMVKQYEKKLQELEAKVSREMDERMQKKTDELEKQQKGWYSKGVNLLTGGKKAKDIEKQLAHLKAAQQEQKGQAAE
jgi:hypothetical protein